MIHHNPALTQLTQSTRLLDISMPIKPGMPVWRNNPHKQPEFETTADYQRGHSWETRIHLDAHTGTHIDAPLHMLEGGQTIEHTSLQQVVRMVRVVDLTHVTDAVGAADIAAVAPQPGEFLLLKTRNSANPAWDDTFVYVATDGAEALVASGVQGVGVDALGVERSQPDHSTHKTLLGAGVVILEGLRLAHVEPGEYFMVAAPLKFEGIEASLARVLLFG